MKGLMRAWCWWPTCSFYHVLFFGKLFNFFFNIFFNNNILNKYKIQIEYNKTIPKFEFKKKNSQEAFTLLILKINITIITIILLLM